MTNTGWLVGAMLVIGGLLQVPLYAMPQKHNQPAPQVEDPPQLDAVEVRGLAAGATIGSYQDLLAGYDRFNELKSAMSPSATLRFALPPGVTEIYAQSPNRGLIQIPVDANGEFLVPLQGVDDQEVRAEKWPLLARSQKAFDVLPAIRSSNSSETLRRVGDLRLYCETLWAMQRGGASVAQRLTLRIMGGLCSSKRVNFIFPTKRRLISAEIEGATKPTAAKISYNAMGFSVPLADKSLSNSAVVRLRFED